MELVVLESNSENLSDGRDDVIINVCITGQYGVGKSRLCNSIIGEEKFNFSGNMDPETTEVSSSEFCWDTNPRKSIKLNVYDTPGLGESKEDAYYLRKLQEQCNHVGVILYCISYKGLDLSPDSSQENESLRHVMRVLHSSPMKHIIVVLTKVNQVKEKEITLQNEIEQLGTKLKNCFDDLSTIPVIPAGLPSEAFLKRDFQRFPWLHQLLHEILKQVGELSSFNSIIQSHPHTKDQSTYNELTIAEQMTYYLKKPKRNEANSSNTKTILGVGTGTGAVGVAVGAGVGATIGALAIGAPTLGVAAGAGVIIGGAIGAGIGGAVGTAAAAGVAKKRSQMKS